jgi:hypothetical protein
MRQLLLPCVPPPRELVIVDTKGESVLHGIDADDITVMHERQGPAESSFGNDMADDEAMGAAGKCEYDRLKEVNG